MKRYLALMLVCALILGMIPGIFAAEGKEDAAPLTEEDYITADLMWEAVNEKEDLMLSKRAPVSDMVDALVQVVTVSPYYKEDSLIRNGDHFFWETIDGIPCGYSPRLAAMGREAEGDSALTGETVLTTSYATKGGSPGAKDVYLIQPYYGLDKDFTTQYVDEANNIARTLGGTATIYRTTGATVDKIADAMEKGAVVIFDSHGDTDYVNPDDSDDYVTEANTSYICLQTNAGLTEKDYEAVVGPYNTYYHAYYAGSYRDMKYYCVDGTVIANHMDKTAPNSILWMALCLSMTTDGLHAPLRAKGVEVAYGYSQSVTFDYDYAWEECFWSEMIKGKNVSQAISAMKNEVGLWDWCHASSYDTIAEAREMYCAFPIVVSSEDKYPGHGKVDDLQTVNSPWSLMEGCKHKNVTFVPEKPATCTGSGTLAYYKCNDCGKLYSDGTLTVLVALSDVSVLPLGHAYGEVVTPAACTTQGYTTYTCGLCGDTYTDHAVPATGHAYTLTITPPSCTAQGYTTYVCGNCGDSYMDDFTVPMGHSFAEGVCTVCGDEEANARPINPFIDVKEGDYYFDPVLWAVEAGITTGTTKNTFAPENSCTRAQVVTFLWRACGSPEPMSAVNPFTDVADGTYYYKAVLWAVEQGITTGTTATTFSPEDTCTRGQVATFLWRAQGRPAPAENAEPFSDVAENVYYYEPILWAVENNITQGTGKGRFSPENECTRGQIVTFLYRTLAN